MFYNYSITFVCLRKHFVLWFSFKNCIMELYLSIALFYMMTVYDSNLYYLCIFLHSYNMYWWKKLCLLLYELSQMWGVMTFLTTYLITNSGYCGPFPLFQLQNVSLYRLFKNACHYIHILLWMLCLYVSHDVSSIINQFGRD